MSPKYAHLSDNRGLYGGAPSGNKRTTNQNAPFQISTNQNEPQICTFWRIKKLQHNTHVYGGVCIESILVAYTIRLHRFSNVWTTRTFVWLNRCATIRIEPPLISSVGSTPTPTPTLPSDSDKGHWIARHVPMSVSVASNVPGHERVQCHVTDGDTNKLVSAMMDILQAMSDTAYDKIKHSYEDVLEQLAEELTNWDEREEAARSAVDKKKSRQATNPYKKLMGQLYGWMHQLPVIGFNSGKYDLNAAIKQFLKPYFLSTTSKTGEQEEQEQDDKEEENEGIGSFFVIKRNNTFMCLSTDQLKFLDMINYIAPGFSYDKYLKAYGCEVTKGHFPYEYMDRLERLDDTALPSKQAFFSRLKNEGISDEDYASCQEA